jgi:hypothetical protein
MEIKLVFFVWSGRPNEEGQEKTMIANELAQTRTLYLLNIRVVWLLLILCRKK